MVQREPFWFNKLILFTFEVNFKKYFCKKKIIKFNYIQIHEVSDQSKETELGQTQFHTQVFLVWTTVIS